MIAGFIQARMNSTRLPQKVLKPVSGKPILQHVIERVSRAKRLDKVVVLTSDHDQDQAIVELCDVLSVECFTGPLNDVLGRFNLAVNQYKPEHLVRITADCPLIEPKIIDAVIEMHLDQQNDYSVNCIEYQLPDGLDVEVMRSESLMLAAKQADHIVEREHVTTYFRRHPNDFKIGQWQPQVSFQGRWTLDEPKDLAFIDAVYAGLYSKTPEFDYLDVKNFLDQHPEVLALNQGIKVNQGLEQMLNNDYQLEVKADGTVPSLD